MYFLGTSVSTTEPECAMRYSIVDAEIAECSSAPDMLEDFDLQSEMPDPLSEIPDPLKPEMPVPIHSPAAKSAMAPQLEGKEVRHRTDSQSAERIMTVGSRNPELHKEAILLYKVCREHNIRLSVEWVSRDLNENADYLSRLDDPDDYKLDPRVFRSIDNCWGPHTYDRFASMKTNQLPRFSSKYMNPGCDSTDAFTVSWEGENNWLFPPPYLIPRVLRHMSANNEYGTLLIPYWPSAPWWPLLINKQGCWNSFVTDCLELSTYNGIFISGSLSSNIFTAGVPPFELRALQLRFK